MGKRGRDYAGRRSGKGYEGRGERGSNSDRWESANGYPGGDLMDMDNNLHNPVNDDYVWPEFENEDED